MSQHAILAGLIGRGIQLSRTPALHEHEGDAQALRYLYRLIDADQLQLEDSALPGLLDAAQHTGFTGLNITYRSSSRSCRCSTNCRMKPVASAR